MLLRRPGCAWRAPSPTNSSSTREHARVAPSRLSSLISQSNPFSRYLTFTAPLHGIQIGSQELCLSLFADDILLFTSDPTSDIPIIISTFKNFKQCSGMKINYSKSEILPLGSLTNCSWTSSSPFQVAKTHITYLGIKIGKVPSSIYTLNCPPLFTKILHELENWVNLPLSLLGRGHLVKMVSFARLVYPLQTLPLLLRHKDVQFLNCAFTKFLWKSKRPRIALKKKKNLLYPGARVA